MNDAATLAKLNDERIKGLERKLARYEHAFGNIETLIDGKADTVDGERSDLDPPGPNDYMSIQMEIDEARR